MGSYRVLAREGGKKRDWRDRLLILSQKGHSAQGLTQHLPQCICKVGATELGANWAQDVSGG